MLSHFSYQTHKLFMCNEQNLSVVKSDSTNRVNIKLWMIHFIASIVNNIYMFGLSLLLVGNKYYFYIRLFIVSMTSFSGGIAACIVP